MDTGIAVNPDTIVAQLQGGLIFGLTAALFGEITIDKGRVRQSNFNDYRHMILWVREGVQGCRCGLFRLAYRGSNGRFRLGEDARRCSSLITRIRRPRWLNQQDMHFPARHGAVLDAGRHYKNFARVEGDGAIP